MTKPILVALTFVIGMALSGIAQSDKYVLVQKSDTKKTISYVVMAETAFKELAATCSKQSQLFSRAVSNAEKDWKADESTKSYSFPKTSLAAPKAQLLGTFEDEAKANEKMAPLQKKIDDAESAKKDAKKADADKEKKKNKDKKASAKHSRLSLEEIINDAAKLVDAKLEELKAGAPAPEAAAEPAAEKAPAAK